MPPRAQQLILFGLGALVVAGLALLAVEASSDQEVEVDEAELARAKARSQQQVSRPAPPAVRPRRQVAAAKTSDEADEEQRQIFKKPAPGIPQPGPPGLARVKGEVAMSPGTEDFVVAMDEANKLYDRGDYMGALEAATELLETQPNNVRMLRVVVSSHCILGNHQEAGEFFDRLPARDQRQMSRRCQRYGVELE
jgi:hypothetical protein